MPERISNTNETQGKLPAAATVTGPILTILWLIFQVGALACFSHGEDTGLEIIWVFLIGGSTDTA
jgi:hypothetical protein